MTYIVGLTGGIGSGKSTIAHFFAECGAPVIDADIIARDLVKPSQSAYLKIVERYGESILEKNGELNRKVLREKIFNHIDEKLWLEALLHPAIYLRLHEKISEIK
jgi:dephospho-CoA kinase